MFLLFLRRVIVLSIHIRLDQYAVCSSPLMCETRNANRSTRDDEEEGSSRPRPRRRVRPRGAGPRGRGRGEDGQNWVLERSEKSSSPQDQEA